MSESSVKTEKRTVSPPITSECAVVKKKEVDFDLEGKLLLGLLIVSAATLAYGGLRYYLAKRSRRSRRKSKKRKKHLRLEHEASKWRRAAESTPNDSGDFGDQIMYHLREYSVTGGSSPVKSTTPRPLDSDSSSDSDADTSRISYVAKSRTNASFLMTCDMRRAFARDYREIYGLCARCFKKDTTCKLLRRLHKGGNVLQEWVVTHRAKVVAYMALTQVFARGETSECEEGVGDKLMDKTFSLDESRANALALEKQRMDESLLSKTQRELKRFHEEMSSGVSKTDDDDSDSGTPPPFLKSVSSPIHGRKRAAIGSLIGVSIGPIFVDEEFRGRRLATYMIETLAEEMVLYPFMVAIGEPDFYSRVSFKCAGRFGLKCKWLPKDDTRFQVRFLSKSRVLNFLSHQKSDTGDFVIGFAEEFDSVDFAEISHDFEPVYLEREE